MSDLHSSLIPRFQPLAKTVKGKTRTDEKDARDKAKARAEDACYALVDARDGLRCRVTGKRLIKGGSLTTRVERHHMVSRGAGGPHETWNVVTVSKAIHDRIEVAGTMRLTGDADARDERGRLAGVKVEELTEAGWAVTRWV